MSESGETAGASPAIDPAALANLKAIGGGDGAFVVELIAMFREDSPPRLDGIAADLARGDATGVAKNAHSLKGSGANFGAERFRALAQSIESAGKSGDLAGVPAMLVDLRTEFDRVCKALGDAATAGI